MKNKQFNNFTISELFEIKKVYGTPLSSYKKGKIPYVTGSQDNNGVIGYVDAQEKDISNGNCIAVDPISGITMYQPIDFVGRGFSGASINLLYCKELNEKNALFICSAIERISKKVASYTNLFNSNRLANAKITLPTKKECIPDFDVIEHLFGGGYQYA